MCIKIVLEDIGGEKNMNYTAQNIVPNSEKGKTYMQAGAHIAYLVFDEERFIGAGGVSFFRVMPTYHNPTGCIFFSNNTIDSHGTSGCRMILSKRRRRKNMRTVKEVSELTDISVRTLHWYDEIGLFKPTAVSDAGYRLYDDKALETLQQILFFREFDMPLKDIKAIFERPDFDRNEVLQSQKKMLELKRNRLDRMINSIEGILKGENQMDFGVFSKTEIEEMYRIMISRFPEEIKTKIIEEFGDEEGYHQHFLNFASSEKGKKHYQKVVELYGDKESVMKVIKYPPGQQIVQAYQNRIDAIMKKLSDRRMQNFPVDSFEVREVIGEYGFIMKRMIGIKDEKAIMTGICRDYKTCEPVKKSCDELYGKGTADFFVDAVENFYQ